MKVEKSGKKWVVKGNGEGWVLTKTFPTKWKAELALKGYLEGGRVSDYWEAAREEAGERFRRMNDSKEKELERAREEFAGVEIPADTMVTVCRHPGDDRSVAVPFSSLQDFHLKVVSGGVKARSAHPMLYARMWCSEIPKGEEFGHSCLHGPPPHEILVCITKSAIPGKLYKMLLSTARA